VETTLREGLGSGEEQGLEAPIVGLHKASERSFGPKLPTASRGVNRFGRLNSPPAVPSFGHHQ
jgi:hypothetical protein